MSFYRLATIEGVDIWIIEWKPEVKVSHFVALSPVEKRASFGIINKSEKGRFLYHHNCLRKILESYVGSVGDFFYNSQGKPSLRHSDLHFSLSKSGRFATVAISSQCAVGVDLEQIRSIDYLAFARRYFHEYEIEKITLHEDVSVALDLFYKLWTRKEAIGKAIGVGLNEDVLKTYVCGSDRVKFGRSSLKLYSSFVRLENRYMLTVCRLAPG